MRAMDNAKRMVGLGLSVMVVSALAACGGSQSPPPGPYSTDLLNNLSQHPPMGEPVPGATTAPSVEAPPAVDTAPVATESPDVAPEDASAPPAMDAAPEASAPADAGRRGRAPAARGGDGGAARAPARAPARRDGGR
jgi:hypothetical protein